MRSDRIGGLADIAKILEHAAGIGEGRVFGDRLVRKPVGNMLGERDGAAADEQYAIEFHPEPELPAGLCKNLFDDFTLGGLDQVLHVMITALQANELFLDGLRNQLLAQGLEVEARLDTIGKALYFTFNMPHCNEPDEACRMPCSFTTT